MAKIRFGYSDDFTAKDSSVGINTAEPQTNLDVVGSIKGKELKVIGVSSQTGYEGFLRADHQIEEETQLNFGHGIKSSLSGEIIVGTGQTVTINEVTKETVAVGNGSNSAWINLVNKNGNANPYSTNPKWNGNAFVFNADGDFRVDNFSETFGTSITVEWWGSSDYPTTNYKVPVMRTTNTAWNDGFGFYQFSGKVYWWVNAWDGAQRTEIAATSFGMTHWVGTYDGSNLKLYRNGSLVDTGSSFTANITDPSVSLDIGGAVGHSPYRWDGSISIVRLYSTALTAAEINAQYKLGPKSKIVVVEPDVVHFNANNPLSYPGTVNTVDTTDTNTAGGSQVECMKVYNTFTPPSGDTNQRPSNPKPGQLYYNYDLKTIEFHDGYGWRQVDNTTQSGRGLIGGGAQPSDTNKSDTIESIQIQSLGGATDFGNLTQARRYVTSCSSSIRGVWAGGLYPTNTDIIDYVTIASGGNAIDFGNIVTSDGTTSNPKSAASSCSSSTRGIFAGGYRPAVSNGINYIEIATTGNALVFGELIQPGYYGSGCSSSVRGVFQGHTNNNSATNYEMITIASKGDAVDFGEANWKRTGNSMLSNSVRGISAGGYNALSPWFSFTVNSIEYITLSSSGSAEYFGDLTRTNSNSFQGCATSARGVFCGGFVPTPSPGVYVSTCDYVTIASTGNATDFGDLNDSRRALGQCSDSHGGLGGF